MEYIVKMKTLFRNIYGKFFVKLFTKLPNLLLGGILLAHLFNLQSISTSTVDIITNGEISNIPLKLHHNRSRDFSKEILNITSVAHDLLRNGRELLLRNIFPRSFIFYTDEISSDLLSHAEILQRHYVFKAHRNTNSTKAEIKLEKTKPSHQNKASGSDEDYFFEYEDGFTARPDMSTAKVSGCSSCQYHNKAKKDSLESIKKHILMRLQLTQPPNITAPIPIVPQKILDLFYKNFNHSRALPAVDSNNNNKQHKRKTNAPTSNKEDVLEDKEDDDSATFYKAEYEPDIMISDNTYDFADEGFPSPSTQSDEFYSRLHSIYVFPTKSRLHHNRKPEIFNFKYNSDPSRISSTILHIFIKGQNWLYEHEPDVIEKKNIEVTTKKKQEIMIVIYRALRRPNAMNYTHTVKLVESRQKIPPGKGHWVEIEIKELSAYWMKTPNSTQGIVISGMESWMRTFIVTEDHTDKSLTMHIEIVTKVKNRYKRNAALDCRESDNEVRCCRYPLKVNFTNFGWNFIVAPQHFDAYFCNGECNIGYLEKHTHTHITSLSHIASLSTSAKPCCSPQKLSPLAILYFDNNNKLMYSTIPNMSVEKCSCS